MLKLNSTYLQATEQRRVEVLEDTKMDQPEVEHLKARQETVQHTDMKVEHILR
jgi:hypothetical protein